MLLCDILFIVVLYRCEKSSNLIQNNFEIVTRTQTEEPPAVPQLCREDKFCTSFNLKKMTHYQLKLNIPFLLSLYRYMRIPMIYIFESIPLSSKRILEIKQSNHGWRLLKCSCEKLTNAVKF